MSANEEITPGRPSRTPSPGPIQQPSSGPNPIFEPSPPKRRGGQNMSIKVKRRRQAKKEAESWTPEQIAAEESRIMQERLAVAAAEKLAEEVAAAETAEKERTVRVQEALQALKKAGYKSAYQFFEEFFSSTDRDISKHSSRLLNDHGIDLLDLLCAKQPELVEAWALKGRRLSELLRPDSTREFTSRLETWSLEEMLSKATDAAPNLCEGLTLMGMKNGREDSKLVLVTVLCMLAQSQNERANEFQEIMGTYFLACSTPRRQFEVLAHAGLTVSYSKALNDLKGLSAEGLARMRRMVQEKACMIVWDNLNIAFKVGEQRHDSKDTFENGTTATLIVLYGVLRGELELKILEPRTTRKPVIDFDPMDTLPSVEHIIQSRNSSLWHVRRVLLDRFPKLGAKFRDDHGDVPLPTPAMKIDESSLDGTMEVIDTIITRTLQFTEAGMRAHGVMFNGGDLLSLNLTDKLSGTRGTVNEHWGEPNSKFPGSLWSQNSFLSRKSIPAGWKAKKLPPFRPTYELMLTLSLPAHILDGFHIYCGADSLDAWVASEPSWSDVVSVSEVVIDKLCSASTVEELRLLPEAERDPQLENTVLCNHDMLLLLLFTSSIKSGDVGMVLNILAHWMVMFWGTGSMPKYADALFELINNLKRWPPALREAYLNNWLVNLSGMINAFKEVDLLQEHQNFWAKVIYNARGSNRSWDWLSMITVVIFNLRDVMRNVQTQFKIPHHGVSHTSPNAAEDIGKFTQTLPEHSRIFGGKHGSESDEEEDVQMEIEMQLDDVEQDDLMHDDEDFTDMADELVGMAKEVVGI
ncbi:hypothetical protein B0H11DRAFT_2162974 [Mycena galericulata]|nr:hypothetical protein B0H11DRAFT_2162974 [Mycena galericulata]